MSGGTSKTTDHTSNDFLKETPIFCCQSLSSKKQSFICALCQQIPTSLNNAYHLSLQTSDVSRKDILKGKNQISHMFDNNTNTTSPLFCSFRHKSHETKHISCTEIYCSNECRDKHKLEHSLLCQNGESIGSPLHEFHKYINQCGKIGEYISHVSKYLTYNISQIIEEEIIKCKPSNADNGAQEQEKNKNKMSSSKMLIENIINLCNESINMDVCKNNHEKYHFIDEIKSEITEAFYLYKNGIENRLTFLFDEDDGLILKVIDEMIKPFMDLDLFLRLVYMFKLRLLTLSIPSHLSLLCHQTSDQILKYVTDVETERKKQQQKNTLPVLSLSSSTQASNQTSSGQASNQTCSLPPEGLLETFGILLKTARRICERKNRNIYSIKASKDLHTQLDLLICHEAKKYEKEEEEEGSSSSSSSSVQGQVQDMRSTDWLILLARRCKLISQCASRLFIPTDLHILSFNALKLHHSCIPTSQVQFNPIFSNKQHLSPSSSSSSSSPSSSSSLISSSSLSLSSTSTALSQLYHLVDIRTHLKKETFKTISWIEFNETSNDRFSRATLLCDRFGKDFICQCHLCKHERKLEQVSIMVIEKEKDDEEEEENTKNEKDFMILFARNSIENGNFKKAISILLNIIKNIDNQNNFKLTNNNSNNNIIDDDETTTNGDIWVLLGLCYLNINQWSIAASAWRKGYELYPKHGDLCKQANKDISYFIPLPLQNNNNNKQNKNDNIVKNIKCNVFELNQTKLRMVSTMSTTPIISERECEYAINLAEDYVKINEGWTTTRHHAVPTTDIAIHTVPKLLTWFNELMEDRIRPLLAHYFGQYDLNSINGSGSTSVNSSTSGGVSLSPSTLGQFEPHHIKVHDAFLVKYKAGNQTHLPLHIDESHLSFTIPLNSVIVDKDEKEDSSAAGGGGDDSELKQNGDYVGGGTYFAELNESIVLKQGSLCMFEGQCLHGGDPVIFGTRYILAVFLYIDKNESRLYQDKMNDNDGSNSSNVSNQLPWDVEDSRENKKRKHMFEKNASDTNEKETPKPSFSFSFF